jgi:hypothetical protein
MPPVAPSAGCAEDAPPVHSQPAAQRLVGAAMPAAAQYDPPGQARGAAEPAGQTSPTAHSTPVTLSLGVATAAPPKQA